MIIEFLKKRTIHVCVRKAKIHNHGASLCVNTGTPSVLMTMFRHVAVVSSLHIDVFSILEWSLDDLVVAAVRSRPQRVAVESSFHIGAGPILE
jgi:hypothetical protein